MEFIDQLAPELKLTPEQVTAIKTKGTEYLATQKQSWDQTNRETANKNAEGILSDVAKRVEALTGIKREESQKYADYLSLSSELYLKGRENTLKEKEAKLEKLIAEGSGTEAIKSQLLDTQKKLEALQQKEALYSEYEKENYKDKYLTLVKENEVIKIDNAFNSVKPKFSEKINPYESAAKWDAFIKSVLEKNTIAFDENNKPIAIDKENKYKITALDKLVSDSKELTELTKGTVISGTGHNPKTVQLDGIPFDLPEKATSEDKTKAIREYLTAKGLTKIHPNYAKEFSGWMAKINELQKKG